MSDTNYQYTKMDRPNTTGRSRKKLQYAGAFQVILGFLFLGCNTLVVLSFGFGYFFGVGFATGLVLIIAGSVAVHKSRTSREPQHKPVKILSVLAAILAFAIIGISGTGVYFDIIEETDNLLMSSTISMSSNIIMAFLGIWGVGVSIWMICTNSAGGIEDADKKESTKSTFNGTFTNGKAEYGGKWAESRDAAKGKNSASVENGQKSSMNSVVVKNDNKSKIKADAHPVGPTAAVVSKDPGGPIPRQSKAFDSISMQKKEESGSDYTDDSYDDEGYDDSTMTDSDGSGETNMDQIDPNDPEAEEKRRRRRRRRRRRYKEFNIHKSDKKATKAVDPFSKDRKIKRTWDKKPKNEFKLTKAQLLRQQKLEEQRKKENKK